MNIAIAGAGVGGLTAALSLHAVGWRDVKVFEATAHLREIGVGLNLPPHAVRQLTELGLGEALARLGVPTEELAYYDRQGHLIWAEPRGLPAGYHWPQYSIHRGKLQTLLLEAVADRLGSDSVETGCRVSNAVWQQNDEVHFNIERQPRAPKAAQKPGAKRSTADALIVADGIRSGLRTDLLGKSIPLASNGWVMYRGVTQAEPFLSGKTMVICGDDQQRIVVYPIGDGLLNWLMVHEPESLQLAGDREAELGNWNLAVEPARVAERLRDWRFPWLDMYELVRRSEAAYVYPMTDIDPLERWVFGRAALLGDAAHAMYPFGSNGASQAILDARVLAYKIHGAASLDDGLQAYEASRRSAATEVQLANRRQAGAVMKKISQLARSNAHAQAAEELQTIEQQYKRMAGFDIETVNHGPSWTVTR